MNLAQACQTLGVSRSGYHAHLRKCNGVQNDRYKEAYNEARRARGWAW
jgi:hypothetical protein